MAHYSAPTPKRHYLWANCIVVTKLDRGRLHLVSWRRANKNRPETCKKYKNKAGKSCWAGTPSLRKTEWLDCKLCLSSKCIEQTSIHASKCQLREYPLPFAKTLANMRDALKAGSKGQPALPASVPSALESFQQVSWNVRTELYQHPNLRAVFTYLRGGKNLKIPEAWAEFIPKAFPGNE